MTEGVQSQGDEIGTFKPDCDETDPDNRTRLIVFLGKNCAPSRLLKAALRQLEKGRYGTLSLMRLDIDAEPERAAEFGVVGTPTILLVRNGVVLRRNEGTMTAADLRKWVSGHR